MKDSREFWIRDLEQLLDETVVKDAMEHVLEKLDEAVAGLHPESRALISKYLDGATYEVLARENAVEPEQVREWINRIKRELTQQLRTKGLVKQ